MEELSRILDTFSFNVSKNIMSAEGDVVPVIMH